jgi:hypothetical protein
MGQGGEKYLYLTLWHYSEIAYSLMQAEPDIKKPIKHPRRKQLGIGLKLG